MGWVRQKWLICIFRNNPLNIGIRTIVSEFFVIVFLFVQPKGTGS